MTRHRPEQQIQKALADHLRFRAAPGIYWFHPANGGARTAIEGAILKACGVRASTPDLICIRSGRTYGLELKTTAGPAHEKMKAAGAEVTTAFVRTTLL